MCRRIIHVVRFISKEVLFRCVIGYERIIREKMIKSGTTEAEMRDGRGLFQGLQKWMETRMSDSSQITPLQRTFPRPKNLLKQCLPSIHSWVLKGDGLVCMEFRSGPDQSTTQCPNRRRKQHVKISFHNGRRTARVCMPVKLTAASISRHREKLITLLTVFLFPTDYTLPKKN